jgi:small subunit ribosomal protein S6
MPLYDLMLLLDPGVPSDRHDAILNDVKSLIDAGGKIVTDQEWGTRRMTFEIDHRPDADYHLLQFETEKGGALLDNVDHSLKIMDGVLRHRIIRLKDGTPPPPPPRAEGRYAEAPAAAEGAPAAEESPLPPEEGEPAAPAVAGTAAAGIPAAPSDEPAPAPAETPPPPDVDLQEAGPAGGGGDDEAPSGPTAA